MQSPLFHSLEIRGRSKAAALWSKVIILIALHIPAVAWGIGSSPHRLTRSRVRVPPTIFVCRGLRVGQVSKEAKCAIKC